MILGTGMLICHRNKRRFGYGHTQPLFLLISDNLHCKSNVLLVRSQRSGLACVFFVIFIYLQLWHYSEQS